MVKGPRYDPPQLRRELCKLPCAFARLSLLTSHLVRLGQTLHGVRLPTSGLPIRKNCSVVALQRRLHERVAALLVEKVLLGVLIEDMVKCKGLLKALK